MGTFSDYSIFRHSKDERCLIRNSAYVTHQQQGIEAVCVARTMSDPVRNHPSCTSWSAVDFDISRQLLIGGVEDQPCTIDRKPSVPTLGVVFRLNRHGIPHSGTTSFTAALEILLDGQAYHDGTQLALSQENVIQPWIKCFRHTPLEMPEHSRIVLKIIRESIEAFVGFADSSGPQLLLECLGVFPDTKVTRTVRDEPKSGGQRANSLAAQANVK